MKRLTVFLIMLLAVSAGSEYRRGVANQPIHFSVRDTTTGSITDWIGNDSNKFTGYVTTDSTTLTLHGRFAANRDTAGAVIGFRYFPLAAEMDCRSCTFYFRDTGAHIPSNVYIITGIDSQTNILANLATLLTRLTAGRAGSIDSLKWLDKAVSRTVDSATYTNARAVGLTNMLSYTVQRAGYLDSLDNKISSRMATFTYTVPTNQFDSTKWTGVRAARIDSLKNLDTKITTRQPKSMMR